MKKKVIILHPDLGIGGAERLIIDIAVVLSEQGHSVTIFTNHFDKKHSFPETRGDFFKIRQIANFVPRNVFGYFHALMAYFKFLLMTIYLLLFQDVRNSIIISDQISATLFILKLFTNAHLIFYCHFPDVLLSTQGGLLKKLYRYPINFIEEYSLNYADLIWVNSQFTANVCRETFTRLKNNLSLLYPSINTNYIDNLKLDTCDEIPKSKKFVFLSINRFDNKKNILLALEALSVLRKQISSDDFDKILLILAGGYDNRLRENRDYFTQLESYCNREQLERHVCFLKSPSDEKKFSLLRQCTCLIYTPINEHFGIVPLEAMYFEKAVIAMDSGGPLETVIHNKTGFHCEPTKEVLAVYMESMLVTDSNILGQNGRQYFDKKFSYQKFSNNVQNYVTSFN